MPKTSHTNPVISDRLTQPVGRFMRPCVSVEATTSIQLAIERMREAGQELIPVVEDGRLVGVLTEAGILRYVGNGSPGTDAVSNFLEPAETILNRATGSEALRKFEATTYLVVVDENKFLCGLITPSSFVGASPEKPYPTTVGGMATPFGVYLTTGSVRGGKKGWYLFSTGFLMFLVIMLGTKISNVLVGHVPHTEVWSVLLQAFPFALMALVFRVHPIAGYHAAEHQVVHAIEREEELIPEVVERMPRVHPRCGTNIVVAAAIFSAVSMNDYTKNSPEFVVLGLFVTLFFWKSVGSFVQYWITTKKPNRKQIESGISAGKELIANYEVAPKRNSSPGQRILNSGMLHVMAGSFTALGIGLLLGWIFKIDII